MVIFSFAKQYVVWNPPNAERSFVAEFRFPIVRGPDQASLDIPEMVFGK
jgi:hypothetical protein